MENIHQIIARLQEIQLKDIKSSDKKKLKVAIDTNSYIGKEIMYQTSLLKDLHNEIKMLKCEIQNIKKNKKETPTNEEQTQKLTLSRVDFTSYPTIMVIIQNKSDMKVSEEKVEWLKSIGATKLEKPATWSTEYRQHLYSDEYLCKTPLEELKRRYLSTLRVKK